MKAKEHKCHVKSTNENVFENIGTAKIRNSSSEKLLEVKIDCKLNFKDDVGSICKKSQRQIKRFDQSFRLHES